MYHCGTEAVTTFVGRKTEEFRCVKCGMRWAVQVKPRSRERDDRRR
jgi:hypothetical protein